MSEVHVLLLRVATDLDFLWYAETQDRLTCYEQNKQPSLACDLQFLALATVVSADLFIPAARVTWSGLQR